MSRLKMWLALGLTGIATASFGWRDQETGTFLTRDPIGYKDGPNQYCYVHCNPVTKFDAFGLTEVGDNIQRWVIDQAARTENPVALIVAGPVNMIVGGVDGLIEAPRILKDQVFNYVDGGCQPKDLPVIGPVATGTGTAIGEFAAKPTVENGLKVVSGLSQSAEIVMGGIQASRMAGGGAQTESKQAGKLTESASDAKGAATSSPNLEHKELAGKSVSEIRSLADEKGLVPHETKADKWVDPVTGNERLRIDPGHIDKSTGQPYNDSKAATEHVHGYEPDGKTKIVDPSDNNPHITTVPNESEN